MLTFADIPWGPIHPYEVMFLYEIMIIAQEIIFLHYFHKEKKKEANFDSQSFKWIFNNCCCIAHILINAQRTPRSFICVGVCTSGV